MKCYIDKRHCTTNKTAAEGRSSSYRQQSRENKTAVEGKQGSSRGNWYLVIGIFRRELTTNYIDMCMYDEIKGAKSKKLVGS